MDDRIVISFRAAAPAAGAGRSFLERARALATLTRARHAVVVAWDANRIAFAFPSDELAAALAIITLSDDDLAEGESPWSVGIAEGDLKLLADDGSQAQLAWGAPLVVASVLSSTADPGEVLCAQTLSALRSGELLAAGTRIARDGALRVRGVLLDRNHPWRRQAVEQLFRMRVAPLVGAPPPPASAPPGSLLVLRADPGTGGTRYLTELAARHGSASRALLITPSGSAFEPLGALRRAFARSITRELSPLLLELSDSLEALVGGDGVTLDVAARLIQAFLWPRNERAPPGLLLIDDAAHVDPATLESCAAAALASGAAFGMVARLDATGSLPAALSVLPRIDEIEIEPLGSDDAAALVGGCTNDALDPLARKRWARLGANVPLGVVESVAFGIVTGDLRWENDKASPRSRVSGRGKVRSPGDWILLRARDENEACRTVLCLIALLGGEAKVTRLSRVLEESGRTIEVDAVLEDLIRGRWLVDTQEDWVALPSRTHRDALPSLLDEESRGALHAAAANILEDEEGAFGRTEAAWQAAQAGETARGSRILLAAARATSHARLDGSTTQLVAFARGIDPSSESDALELLAGAVARAESLAPPAPDGPVAPASVAPRAPVPSEVPPSSLGIQPFDAAAVHDSEPPTLARESPVSGSSEATAENVATRLGELAKDALLSADNALLERWVDGLRATGESPLFAERLRALSRLGRGEIGDALRVLRRTRAQLDPLDHAQRCQTSLALGVALSVAGRPQEALLEGMDALARARHAEDDRGARACLAFLSKLYTSVGRTYP